MKFIKKIFKNFYRSIIFFIFKLFHGKITSIMEAENNPDIQVKKVQLNKTQYKIFLCNRSRIYTDTIHDMAVIKDNKILNGPSFQYRKLKSNGLTVANAECKFNSVFIKGTPRFKKKLKGSVFSLLTGGGGNNNYWHWLFDVLPRLCILEESKINKNELDYYLFPNLSKKFQNESLDLINIPKNKRLSSRELRHISADTIIATSHPYNLLNNPYQDSLKIPNWIFNYLRLNFLKKALKNSKIKSYPEKVYINRKDSISNHSLTRYIINLEETEKIIEKNGYSNLSMSDFSFCEQVALFYNAKEVIGLHGAGFANTIFCKHKTKIIEMRPDTAGDVIKNLAINNKLIYHDISCKPKTLNYNNQTGDIEIDLKTLEDKLLY